MADSLAALVPSGRFLALTSNARNGQDQDLYLIRPPSPTTGRRVMEAWGVCVAYDWSPDDRRVAAAEFRPDGDESRVHLIDAEAGTVETLPQPAGPAVIRSLVAWSKDGGALCWVTNRDSEFRYLARYDLATRREVALTARLSWDVTGFDLSDDGGTLVVVANEEGISRLHVLDAETGAERPAPRLAAGQIVSFR